MPPTTTRTATPAATGTTAGTAAGGVRRPALGRARAEVHAALPATPADGSTWDCPNCRHPTTLARKRCADCGTSRY